MNRVPPAGPVAVAALAVTATVLVAVVDPNEPGHYPSCPILALTGLYCPGCGSLRAVHALAHGDVAAALGHNPLTTLAIPLLVVAWIVWVRRQMTGRPAAWSPPPWTAWGLVGGALAFGVVRNLPGFEVLAP